MSSNDIEGYKRPLWIAHIILQQFVAVIITYTISARLDGNLDPLWSWHKVLTPIGVVLIMFEGILAFSPYNHITSDFKKTTLNNIHGIFMAAGLSVMTVGVSFAYVMNHDHFTSLHGIVGLISWILCVSSAIGGIFAKYSYSLRDHIRPIYLRFFHTLVGLSAFLTSLFAIGLGFCKLIHEKPDGVAIILALVASIAVAILLTSGRRVVKHTAIVLTS